MVYYWCTNSVEKKNQGAVLKHNTLTFWEIRGRDDWI